MTAASVGEGQPEPMVELTTEMPTGVDIARWFIAEHHAGRFHNEGGNATLLSEEPTCWLWHLSTVDHDDQEFYLLDIGTGGTSDLLFVTSGLRCEMACEWRQRPSAEQQWGYEGLVWFAGLIESYEEGWNADG